MDFKKYENEAQFGALISQRTGVYFNDYVVTSIPNNGVSPNVIMAFAPTAINAGNDELLTITGNGFGAIMKFVFLLLVMRVVGSLGCDLTVLLLMVRRSNFSHGARH